MTPFEPPAPEPPITGAPRIKRPFRPVDCRVTVLALNVPLFASTAEFGSEIHKIPEAVLALEAPTVTVT